MKQIYFLTLLLCMLFTPFTHTTAQVKDTIPPTIKLIGKDTVRVEVHTAYIEAGVILSDNYYSDSSLRSLLTVKNYVDTAHTDTYQVVYSVTDPSGNGPVKKTRTVFVIDTIPPVIVLMKDTLIYQCRWKNYTDSGYVCWDNYDKTPGHITISREGSFADFNTNTEGLFSFRYKAVDSHRNIGYSKYRYVLVGCQWACYEDGDDPCEASVAINQKLQNLSIFPNPADNQLTVKDKSETLNLTSYTLSDITGKVCQQANVSVLGHTLSISTAGLSNGIYLLTIFTSHSGYTCKVTVKH